MMNHLKKTSSEEPAADSVAKNASIIYFSLLVSQFVYGAILISAKKFNLGPFPADPLVMTLLCLAVVFPILGQKLCAAKLQKAKSPQEILTALIIGWSFAETATVLGVIIAFNNGQGAPFLATFAYCLSFFVRLRPRRELFLGTRPYSASLIK